MSALPSITAESYINTLLSLFLAIVDADRSRCGFLGSGLCLCARALHGTFKVDFIDGHRSGVRDAIFCRN